MKTLKLLVIGVLFTLMFQNLYAQVGINTLNPDSASVLHIKSENKGVIFPNVNKEGRNRLKLGNAEGLFLYDDTEDLFYYRNKGNWTVLNPWRINDETVSSSNYIHLGEKYKNANVYIGSNLNSTITHRLHVDGSSYLKDGIYIRDDMQIKYGYTTCMSYKKWRDFGTPMCIGTPSTLILEHSIITLKATDRVVFESPLAEAKEDIFAQRDIIAKRNLVADTNVIVKGEFIGYGTIPLGGIIMWSGTNIPDGWALCDGTTSNGYTTPDLRGRFIVGAGQSTTSHTRERTLPDYKIGDKGGINKYVMSVEEMPSHNHGMFDKSDGGGGDWRVFRSNACGENYDATYDLATQYEGGSEAHENRPPYYTLAFIMRVK